MQDICLKIKAKDHFRKGLTLVGSDGFEKQQSFPGEE